MNEADKPVPEVAAPGDGPGHSGRAIALRVLAAALVAAGAFAVQRLLLDDSADRNTYGARIVTRTIDSQLLERELPARVVVPKDAPERGRSLVVFLHGRGEDERSYLDDEMFEALAARGKRAPLIAFPSAGRASYWHDRDSGQWGTYVRDEVIPQLVERFDVRPNRVAIGGISMGGFGALDIARLSPGRFCAVGAHSPAIWEEAADAADGAFDDAADFERHDVIAAATQRPSPYAAGRIWLDAGESDPFLPADEVLEKNLRAAGLRPIVSNSPGGHSSDYWGSNWDAYLTFYARALADCEITKDEVVPSAGAALRGPRSGDERDEPGEPDTPGEPERPQDDPPSTGPGGDAPPGN